MTTCAHCGAKVNKSQDEELAFCCIGCQTVYQILAEKKSQETEETKDFSG